MGRRLAFLWCLFFVAYPLRGQERPLRPITAEVLPVGTVDGTFEVEFLQRQRYPLSGLEGDLTRLGMMGFRVGVGEYAEFGLSWVAQDFLAVTRRNPPVIPPDFSGTGTSDVGNAILETKLKLVSEKGRRPAFSFRFAVELPNASNESGLGEDVTQFFSTILVSKRLGETELTGNAGLAILQSAVKPNSQSDMLTYALKISRPIRPKIDVVGEVYGRQGPERIGNESLAQVQLGLRLQAAGLDWNVAGIAGLRRFNPRYGVVIGVTYRFQAFRRHRRSPVIIR